MSFVLDASVWVSAAMPDDVNYQATRIWLEAILPTGTLVTPTLGLLETAGAVARRTGSAALARRMVTAIEQLPNVVVVIPDAELWSLSVQVASERALRGADAVYVALAQALNLPLVTWDAEQRQRAGRRVRTLTPRSER